MKDRVFIVWSGSKEVASCVKTILETEYNYVCIIGGNSENDSSLSSVGDTVIQQMKSCNQAIVIFQNNDKGELSDNLFFELGYAVATYGQKKVHCVKKDGDKIVLPSDFDNAFVEPISCKKEVEGFSKGIVEYFITRQKMSINDNKMVLINNRYLIHEKIESHYSNSGSKCSDYELAQYILYYMQSAHMFNDIPQINEELIEFKRKNNFDFSKELSFAVNISLSFFELSLSIKEYEDSHEVYIEENDFFTFKKAYEHYLKSIESDDFGIFDEWATVFVNQHLNFGYMIFGNNTALDHETRTMVYKKCVEYAEKTIESIAQLEKVTPSKENHDDRGILALLRAYVYRNLYVAKKFLQEEDALKCLKISVEQREYLKNNYGKGSIDTQIYSNFCMEYYLALVNYIDDSDSSDMDPFDIMMYKKEINEYIQSVKKYSKETAYLHKIQAWCDRA